MNSILVEELLKYPNLHPIDIRDHDRFLEGHLPGAINIPMAELTRDSEKYLNKNQKYYMYCMYCEFGYKTKRISRILNEIGYQIIDVKDGYYAYEMLKK